MPAHLSRGHALGKASFEQRYCEQTEDEEEETPDDDQIRELRDRPQQRRDDQLQIGVATSA